MSFFYKWLNLISHVCVFSRMWTRVTLSGLQSLNCNNWQVEAGSGVLSRPLTQVISLTPAFPTIGMIDLTARGVKKEWDVREERDNTNQHQALRGDKSPHRWQSAVCEIINGLHRIINPPVWHGESRTSLFLNKTTPRYTSYPGGLQLAPLHSLDTYTTKTAVLGPVG